jgi:hypothetical protein
VANNDDEVGFGKPPKHSQFKKGVSGNPKGRPKGSRNLTAVLAKTLRERVVVNENGRRRTMTKLDAAVAQLVNKSASGDLAAMRQLIILASSTDEQSAEPTDKNLSEADAKVMSNVLKRLKNCEADNEGNEN